MTGVGLSTALNTALSSLNVNQQQLAVLSQNIANANTPGYSLQTANQQAVYLDGQGSGVSTAEVIRQVNENLINAVQQQNSAAGQANTISDYNNQIQNLIGQPGNNNSLDSFVSTFFSNLQALAQTPQNTALQQAAVNSGVTLASQVQQTAQGLYSLQLQTDGDITSAVTAVNNDLTSLASVNHDIASSTLQGQSVAGLQDQRDSLLTDISQYLNIQTYNNSDGSISVTTGSGVTLLDPTITYQLSYSAATSLTTFTNGGSLAPLQVYATDSTGNLTGTPVQLTSAGVPSAVTSTITSGKLAGLLTMRDQQIPNILDQLDTLAANLRDQVNAVENSGSGFPGSSSLTGERSVNAQNYSQWGGSVQIAVLNSSGQPIPSPYSDEPNGMPPLTLDLSSMNTGTGTGNPSVQGIINAINQYYGPQQNKVEVGNLNNIQLVSDSASLPNSASQFNFDLNLDNISASTANLFVTGVSVTPSSGSAVTVTSPTPSINISNYTTTDNSGAVTVNTTGSTAGLTNGETVYLSDPGTSIAGIAEDDLTGAFVISGVGANSFTITAAGGASASVGATVGPIGTATVTPPYAAQPAGQNSRTTSNGLFNIALGSNPNAASYTVTLNVAVADGSGNPPAVSQITYLVTNNQPNLLNQYYAPQTANGDGTIVAPTSAQPVAQALLVDANGNELPKSSNGNYVNTQNGYLEIKAAGSTNVIALNSLDSEQQGQPNNTPPVAGSDEGFSQYFGLNNFFTSNNLTATGDSVAGSAANLSVVQSLQADPGLISLGTLVQNTQPVSGPPNYTYLLNPGDNSVIQNMAALSSTTINFPTSGGLGATSQTFDGYASAIIGATSSNATTATTNQTNAQTLLAGYQKQASAVSGVNLDTELANTIIYQNAYAASARVITVTSSLFDTLLQSFQ